MTRKAERALADYRHAARSVKDEKKLLKEAKKELALTEQAQTVIQEVAHAVQQQVHERVASVVSRCLAAVFDDPYDFKIDFLRKRGKTEAKLSFVSGDHEVDPRTACGGGILDVAAFALRLACLVMTRPKPRRLLVLDEPFRSLQPAEYYHPRVSELLESLADELKVQFVIVSHEEELQIGKVIQVGSSQDAGPGHGKRRKRRR
jgi:DNA repair exonuclease SbcCD ATPase subunit